MAESLQDETCNVVVCGFDAVTRQVAHCWTPKPVPAIVIVDPA
jgi:hypothetical protein